jgi:hypothetical protein
MKHRSLIVLSVVALLGLCAPTFAQPYLDIALEGPWILYEEQQFKSKDPVSGKDVYVPVLVAISPSGATAYSMSRHDVQDHHEAQMSTGEGYYIRSNGIFCLTFGDKCYPQANGASLKVDSQYPNGGTKGGILPVPFGASGDTTWPWQLQGAANRVLILPMPDSYHNDGVWAMRFRGKHDLSYTFKEIRASIGIVLHYSKGPDRLGFYGCDTSHPAWDNCTTPETDSQGDQVSLDNTGTLRLQMRAPDNEDACDHHVRRGYHVLFHTISSTSNQAYAFIEPAKRINADGSGVFESPDKNKHPCWTKDLKLHDQDDSLAKVKTSTASGNKKTAPSSGTEMFSTTMFIAPLTDIQNQLKQFMTAPDSKLQVLDTAEGDVVMALSIANSRFPTLSDVRRIKSLPNDAADSIKQVLSDKDIKIKPLVRAKLLIIVGKLRALSVTITGATKNGADCRAAMVVLRNN